MHKKTAPRPGEREAVFCLNRGFEDQPPGNSGPSPEPKPPLSSPSAAGTPLAASAASASAAARSCSSPQSTRLSDKADLPLVGIDAKHLDLDFIADFDNFFGVLDLVFGELADVQQTFQTVFESDEDTESW